MGLRVLACVPGWPAREAILRNFLAEDDDAVITSCLDPALPPLKVAAEDHPWAEVHDFPKVVADVRLLAGGETLKLGSSAMMRRILQRALEDHDLTGRIARLGRSTRFVDRLGGTLSELHAWGWNADDLTAAAPHAVDHREWISLLGTVDRVLGEELAARGRVRHHDHLDLSTLGPLDFDGASRRYLVFLDGEEHPLRERFLNWMAQGGAEVTVVTERHPIDAPLFDASRRSESRLGGAVQRVGDAARVIRGLFGPLTDEGVDLDVSELVCLDAASEAEWALRAASQSSSAGIYCRDSAAYAPRLVSAGKALGIPVAVPRKAALGTSGIAATVLACLELAADPDCERWAEILGSSSFALGGAARAAARAWCEDGSGDLTRLLSEVTSDERGCERLTKFIEWLDEARTPASWDTWSERLRTLAHEVPWATATSLDPAAIARERNAASALQSELTALLSFLPADETVGANQFRALVAEAVEETRATVPGSDDGIPVANHPAALPAVDLLVVLGCVENAFPRHRQEDPFLTDDARDALDALRGDRPPLLRSADVAAGERDVFFRACAFARTALVLARPVRSGEGPAIPSPYLPALLGSSRDKLVQRPPREVAPKEETRWSALSADPLPHPPVGVSEQTAIRRIRHAPGEALTLDELWDASECDLRYALRHRLKLRGRRDGPADLRWQEAAEIMALDAEARPEALSVSLTETLARSVRSRDRWDDVLRRSAADRVTMRWAGRERIARDHWRHGPATVWKYGEGEADGGLGRITLTGPFFPVAQMADGALVVRLAARKFKPSEPSARETFRIAVAVWGLRKHRRPVYVEMETMGQRRTLLYLDGDRPPRADSRRGLDTQWLEPGPGTQGKTPIQSYMDRVRPVVIALERVIAQGRAEARPGEGCGFCGYGELCRRHLGYGDRAEVEEP